MWEYGKDQFQNVFTQLLFSRALLQNFLLAFTLCLLTCISYRCHIDHIVTSLSDWESIFVVCDADQSNSLIVVTFDCYAFRLSYLYIYLPSYMHLYELNNAETRTWFIFLGRSHISLRWNHSILFSVAVEGTNLSFNWSYHRIIMY